MNGQVARTRGCAETGSKGVPVGTQTAVPVSRASGWPMEVTCTAPTTHWAVTQGPLPAGGTNAQPATIYGAAIVAAGWPATRTRGLGVVGMADPPCAHKTTAPMCKIGAGMAK